jgi:hypothetical protein
MIRVLRSAPDGYADLPQHLPKLARPTWVRLIAPTAGDAKLDALLAAVQERTARLPIAKRRKLARRGMAALAKALTLRSAA